MAKAKKRKASKIPPKFTRRERTEAIIVAEQLLCRRWADTAVTKVIREKYTVSWGVARKVVDTVYKHWKEEVSVERGDMKKNALRVLGEITRLAIKDGKLSAAISSERLRAEIEGTIGGDLDRMAAPVAEVDEEFRDRSEADYLYYAKSGCWPEDEPTATIQ